MEALLKKLNELGVKLWLDGDRLGIRAPKGALTAELRQGLASHREDLLAMLRSSALQQESSEAAATGPETPATTSPDRSTCRIFAHSYKDIYLVGLSALELSAVVYLAISFSSWGWPALLGWGVLATFLGYMNYQAIAHNFIHTPFFSTKGLNACFSILNTLAIGTPQTLYRAHHLNHHQYNNRVGAADKPHATDRSSIYLYSCRPGVAESIWRYAFLSPIRGDIKFLLERIAKQGYSRRLIAEVTALLMLWVTLLIWNAKYFFLFYLPVCYLSEVVAYAENYREHYKANPGNRMADAVSCYGKTYNLLCFNNGYHQEHHYRPQTHWTQMESLRKEMLPESERRVAKWAHWFNL